MDDELKSLLWEKREQVDHNCDVCTSLLLGAFVPGLLGEAFSGIYGNGSDRTDLLELVVVCGGIFASIFHSAFRNGLGCTL